MPIKLNDISSIATIIKTKYGGRLCDMHFLFCFKKSNNSYFIFQEIQGMPVRRIVYQESNNSVTFSAGWSSWANPYALVVDANYEEIENWKDVVDRARPYNSYIEVDGGFNAGEWQYANKSNKTEKKKRHKNKVDTFAEFRIDKIRRAVFNNWGFEIYSPTISMVGFVSRNFFPYQVSDAEGNQINNLDSSGSPSYIPAYIPPPSSYPPNPVDIDEDDDDEEYSITESNSTNKVVWQGNSFYVPEHYEESEDISQVSTGNGGAGYDLSSYWDENDVDDDGFDEELADMLIRDKKAEEKIINVGQREINLFLDD
jgi:hypothetical protein